MINIYDFKNSAKYAMWYNIDAMFHSCLSHICINTSSTLLASSSSPTITQMDTTSDITVKSTETGDTTSGIR